MDTDFLTPLLYYLQILSNLQINMIVTLYAQELEVGSLSYTENCTDSCSTYESGVSIMQIF